MAFISFRQFRVKFRGEDLGILDADKVTMNQALQLEDKTGMTLQQLVNQLGTGSVKAVRAVVWFQYLRAGKPFELFQDFAFEDFDIEPIEDEPEVDPTQAADAADGSSPSPSKSDVGSTSRS